MYVQVAWMLFYLADYESDTETLHQLGNYIRRRHVKAKVKENLILLKSSPT